MISLQVNNITHAQGLSNVFMHTVTVLSTYILSNTKDKKRFKLENPVIQVEALHVDFVAYMYTCNVHVHYVQCTCVTTHTCTCTCTCSYCNTLAIGLCNIIVDDRDRSKQQLTTVTGFQMATYMK